MFDFLPQFHWILFLRLKSTETQYWLAWWRGAKQATNHYQNQRWFLFMNKHIYMTLPQWSTWWRHQMETFSALLAICVGNSPVPGQFPAQRPVTRSFDVFFDLRLNKRLSKQSLGWWFETPSCPLWHHFNQIDENSCDSFRGLCLAVVPCSNHQRLCSTTQIMRLIFVHWNENIVISMHFLSLPAQECQCSQWWKFHQNEHFCFSVFKWNSPLGHI